MSTAFGGEPEAAVNHLRVGVDVGGTFTDLVAVDQGGAQTVLKTLSTPRAPEEGVLRAIDLLLQRYPAAHIDALAHSTTIATNALLGQLHLQLPRIAFVTTEGFADVIEIGRQNRSELYNFFVQRPTPLVERADRIQVRERIDERGNAIVPLLDDEIARIVGEIDRRDVAAVAIGLLHSYADDTHERRIAAAVRAAHPDVPLSCSALVDPQYREYERFSTTIVNAALQPIVERYLVRLQDELRARSIDAPLLLMQSNGGMAAAARISEWPASMIQSGPAAGAIAAAELARRNAMRHAIAFDMGGTTAKASAIADGRVQTVAEFEAAGSSSGGRQIKGSGYPVRFPFVDLVEVGAGGGTIARVQSGALVVGPVSAGADPGPACYGKSDEATVTDADVVLGRLHQRRLAGGSFPIDASRSYDAIGKLARAIGLSVQEAAQGIVRIVDAQMARAVRMVTVERGLDPRDFTLVAYGGNGPLHACALADDLGVDRVVVPPAPGVFSARGLLNARQEASLLRPILATLDRADSTLLDRAFSDMEQEARAVLCSEGVDAGAIASIKTYDARYRGQSFDLQIEHASDLMVIARRFHDAHRRRFGYSSETETVELVNARVTAFATASPIEIRPANSVSRSPQTRHMWDGARYVEASVFERAAIGSNLRIEGPAAIEEYDACTYVARGWSAKLQGDLVILAKDG